jgi:hypothetical protein
MNSMDVNIQNVLKWKRWKFLLELVVVIEDYLGGHNLFLMLYRILIVMGSILVSWRDFCWLWSFIQDRIIKVLILLDSIYFRYRIDLCYYSYFGIYCIFCLYHIELYLYQVDDLLQYFIVLVEKILEYLLYLLMESLFQVDLYDYC